MSNKVKTIKSEQGRRVFLFLQGHPSTFACNVARELERRGHRTLRINFCLGDKLLWQGLRSRDFRKPFWRWEPYLNKFIERFRVTDIVYYGDRKPYHQVAAKIARERGINSYVYEFGYLRPDWITLERGGMSAFSHFPNDPDLIRSIAKDCKQPDLKLRFLYTKPREIFYEVTYNLLSYFTNPFMFPFYHADRYYNPIVEYVSGIPGLILENYHRNRARALTVDLARRKHPFFIFSLQLQSDYQLRSNAPFKHQKQAIEKVIKSFAANASEPDELVFKAHPLDNGLEGWGRFIKRKSEEYGVKGRVHYIIGGNLHMILKAAKGCILINSTVGLLSIQAECPVKVLGTAVYDMEGLTCQGTLDDFWSNPTKPDQSLMNDLAKVMAATIQVKGNFFTKKGQRSAVPAFAEMLIKGQVNGKGAFIDPPPRLASLEAAEEPLFKIVDKEGNA